MATATRTERYAANLHGALSCFDRIMETGTLLGACYADGMTRSLNAKHARNFIYSCFAATLRDRIRAGAEELAMDARANEEFTGRARIRKRDVVAYVIESRGDHPELVHVIVAVEACSSCRPWHDKETGQTYLKPMPGKCLDHYL